MTSPRAEYPWSPPRRDPPNLENRPTKAKSVLRSAPSLEDSLTKNSTPTQSWREGIASDFIGPPGISASAVVSSPSAPPTKRKTNARHNPRKTRSGNAEQSDQEHDGSDSEEQDLAMSDDSSHLDDYELHHPLTNEIHTPVPKSRLSVSASAQPPNSSTINANVLSPLRLAKAPELFQSPCHTPKAPQPNQHFSPSPTPSPPPPSSPSSSIEAPPTALPSSILLGLRNNIRALLSDYFILRGAFPQILDPQQLLRRENFGPRGEDGAGEWLTELEISVDKLYDAALATEATGGDGSLVGTGNAVVRRSASLKTRDARKLILQAQKFESATAGYESMREKLDDIRESLEARNGDVGEWRYKPDISFEILGNTVVVDATASRAKKGKGKPRGRSITSRDMAGVDEVSENSASRSGKEKSGGSRFVSADAEDEDEDEDEEIMPVPKVRAKGKLKLLKIFGSTAASTKQPLKRKHRSLSIEANGAGVENESDDDLAPIPKRQRLDKNHTNITTNTGTSSRDYNSEPRKSHNDGPTPVPASGAPRSSDLRSKQPARYESASEESDSVSEIPATSGNKKKAAARRREDVTFPNLNLSRSYARSEKLVGALSRLEGGNGTTHVGGKGKGREIALSFEVSDSIRGKGKKLGDLDFPSTTGTTRVEKPVPPEVESARAIRPADAGSESELQQEKSALLQLAEYAISSGGISKSGMQKDKGQLEKLLEPESDLQRGTLKRKKRKSDDTVDDDDDDDSEGGTIEVSRAVDTGGGQTGRPSKIRKVSRTLLPGFERSGGRSPSRS